MGEILQILPLLEEHHCQPEASKGVTCRILVVDDDRQYLDVVVRTLRRAGHEVLPATGAHQALEIVTAEPRIDVLLSDVAMPEMQGTELVRTVAQVSPETAAVLMTGGPVPEGERGNVTVLRKPLRSWDLVASVETALARSLELRTKLAEAERSAELLRTNEEL